MTDPLATPTNSRVLIIDDHLLFAQAMAAVIGASDGIEVIGTATTLAEGLDVVRSQRVDVVLLDYRLPDGSGLDGVESIHQLAPHAAVVMVTASDDERVLLAAIQAGCAGFVMKTADLYEVQMAVKRAAVGEASISPNLLSRLLGQLNHRGTGIGADLTNREREVLVGIGQGLSNAEIAERIVLSVNTVRNYVQSILAKLGAHSKLEAAAIAAREGLIDPQSRGTQDVDQYT